MCIQHQVTTLRNPLLTLSPWCKKLSFATTSSWREKERRGEKIERINSS
jgi:hypothetical protein